MKKRMKSLFSLTLATLLLAVSLPGFAAKIEDQPAVTFYQNDQEVALDAVQPGQVYAKVRLASEDGTEDKSVLVILASYNATGLEQVTLGKPEVYKNSVAENATLQPGETIFETKPVTVPTGGYAKLFLWDGWGDLAPIGNGRGIKEQSTNCLSAVKVGSYITAVDAITGKILVNTDADISAEAVTDVVIPAGATHTVATGNKSLTVTFADGEVKTYPIVKASGKFSYFDFEGATSLPTSGKDKWYNASSSTSDVSVAYAPDPLDSSNTVIKLEDNSTTNSAIARYSFTTDWNYPYVVSYRVMYGADGLTDNDADEESATDDPSYSGLRLYDQTQWSNMACLVPYVNANGDAVWQACKAQTTYHPSSKMQFNQNAWHEVSIAFIDEETVQYYADGKLVCTGAPGLANPLNSLRFETHKGRTSMAYLDDVMIRNYYLAGNELTSVSFKNGEENVVEGYLYNGKVYANAETLEDLSLGAYTASEDATVAFKDSKITVTSSEGKVNAYDVVARPFFTQNFDTMTLGKNPDSQDSRFSGTYAKNDGINYWGIVQEETEGGNQYLQLYDNDTSKKSPSKITDANITGSKHFVVDYRVRYTEIGTNVPRYFTTYAYTSDGTEIISVGTDSTEATKLKLRTFKSGPSNPTISTTYSYGQWYHVRMIYESDGTAATTNYYIDDMTTPVKTFTSASDGVSATHTFGYLYLSTHNANVGIADYDDITILPLDD